MLLVVMLSVSACATRYHTEGAATGGIIGGIAGALLDHRNPWRGGVIGAALGAMAGATIADISVRGSRQAYDTGRPVEYRTEDRRGYYRAEPEGDYYYTDSGRTKCKKVRERVWEDDRLVKDTTKEICESVRYERGYDRDYDRRY
ncbi:MAG: glycine zipper 2TM domain-containing protein [Nitrospirales bacterium]|nr:glycine zipper 2TM domain-containing protein [Nitrospirales bacterium]